MATWRGSGEAPLTLFSFMDIVTSLSGIVLLVILSFLVNVRSASPPPAPAIAVDLAAEIAIRRGELADLQAAARAVRYTQTMQTREEQRQALEAIVNELRRELAALREESGQLPGAIASNAAVQAALRKDIQNKQETDRIRFLAGPGSKNPVLIVCAEADMRCARVSAAAGPRVFSTGATEEIIRHVAQHVDAQRQSLVLMLKPSSARYASRLIRHWQNAGYDVGWDPLEEGAHIDLGPE